MKSGFFHFFCTAVLATLTLLAASILSESVAVVVLFCIGVALYLLAGDKRNAWVYLLAFIFGPLAEAIGIYFGKWSYSSSWVLGFPIWLPFVWGNAALFIVNIKRFANFLVKRYSAKTL